MNAEILCVGTEILLGDIVNTNAAYIARELAACGIGCYYQTVVGDNPQRLRDALEAALARADMVITTGGLGPTYDDLTKETVAAHFKCTMELHEPSLRHLREIFARFGRSMTPNNEKQAMLPKGCTVFVNDRGTAPGLAVEGDGKIVIMLPGPPREMTAMFENQIRPYLRTLSSTVLVSRGVHMFGIGESALESELREYMEASKNPTVAPYAKEGEVMLRVTASAGDAAAAGALIDPVVAEICERYKKYVYGIDVGTLENALVLELTSKGKTVAVAESCTGGLIAQRITHIAGASKVFGCGVCTYSNEMKTQLLKVSGETLTKHGAVSPQTAEEMVRGLLALSGADYGVAVTGIAGPDGGTPEKPVGLVYLGIGGPNGVRAVELRLSRGYGGERAFIRSLAASNALYQTLIEVRG